VGKLDATGVANFMFVAAIPWMIKPAYGLLSDFFPIFGYRRKSYLLLLNLLAAGSFLLVIGVHSTSTLVIVITLTGIGVAASDVVVDAMMVQTGRETGRTKLFQSAQWVAITSATILSGLLGSAICHRFKSDATAGLRTASLICMLVPLVVAVLTWFMVVDQRAAINLPEFKATSLALLSAFKSLRLWVVVLFVFLIRFNPGIVTALYTHLENQIGISNAYLAILDTANAVGLVAGSLIFMFTMSAGKMSTRRAMRIGLIIAALGVLPMLTIKDKTTATIAYAIWGLTDMIAVLGFLNIAAEACPRRVEAVVFAALMSVSNLGTRWSDVAGSKLYEGTFHHRIGSLIWLCAGFTAAGLLFIPFLKPAAEEENAGIDQTAELTST
jgi:MFS family permease